MVATAMARGDEIRLKNGSVIYGKIVREDADVVVIDLGRGRMNVARRDIVLIKRAPTPELLEGEKPPVAPLPGQRQTREAPQPAQDAIPAKGGLPRALPPQVPRRKRERPPAAGPKVVPVERTPAPRPPGTGPDSASPSRKATKPTTTRPTAKPDW